MRFYAGSPDLKEAIPDNYQKGVLEGDLRAPQAGDRAFIERVKATRGPMANNDPGGQEGVKRAGSVSDGMSRRLRVHARSLFAHKTPRSGHAK
jgi:hypothetical protein